DCARFSGILHVTHITSRSIAGSDTRGAAEAAGAPGGRIASASASARARPRAARCGTTPPERADRPGSAGAAFTLRARTSTRVIGARPAPLPASGAFGERGRAAQEGAAELPSRDRDDAPSTIDDEGLGQLV